MFVPPPSKYDQSLLCFYYRAVYIFQEQMDLPFFAEFSLRCVVLAAQVSAEMWRRNGLSLISQVRSCQILVYLSALLSVLSFISEVL